MITNRRTIKDRRCGYCNVVLTTNADGLISHSMERHGKASPPRPPSKGKGYNFSNTDMIGLLAKAMFGRKKGARA